MTAAVHPHSAATYHLWLDRLPADREPAWPEESGGARQLGAILDRCQWLEEGRNSGRRPSEESPLARDDWHYVGADAVLADLLRPERERQLRGMGEAMGRVCLLLCGPDDRYREE